MNATSDRVVIVGGGVIGAACAHYLAKQSVPVTVIDQSTFGSGCSHGNCGYICPSHVLPFAGPGALRSTLKTLLQKNSPLKVRFRLDPALWMWFVRFMRRCNERDMLAAGQAIHVLLQSSRTLYDELFRDELRGVEWETRGLLFVFQTEHAFEHYAQADALLRREFQVGATRYDRVGLEKLEPALRPGLAGAWHYESDGHLRPDRLMQVWRKHLASQGVEIHEQCAMQAIVTDARRGKKLVTSQGEIPFDKLVVATGAWTPQLSRQLRCTIPIQPGKGYSITMPRPARAPTIPLIFEEHRVAITPFQSGYRIGSTMEFAGYDATLNPRRLQLLTDGAKLYLHEPQTEPVVESWWGWRPMTPDSLPLIGPCPAFENVYLATGHNMLGLSMAPGTGRLVAEMLTGQTSHLDMVAYSPARWM